MKRLVAAAAIALSLAIGGSATTTLASDHLFNAATSNGADNRGFANPVAGNPSGTSGAAAQPGTVPGEGNPNAGGDLGTPSVDLGMVSIRTDGHGNPTPAQ